MAKKSKRSRDPFYDREAEKYEKPIPSREFIIQYLEEKDRPVTRENLIKALDLKSDEEQEALRRRLIAMERDGQIMGNRRGSYGLVDKLDLIKGRVLGHKDGFGFLVPEEGGGDIFLTPRQMRTVFPGDRVLVRVTGTDRRGRREGMIVEVLEHNTEQIVGRFFIQGGIAFVSPDNKNITQDVIIPPGEEHQATHGQVVVAQIIVQPSIRRQPLGRVVEILGDHMAPGLEIEVAIRAYGLPYQWPEAVLADIAKLDASTIAASAESRLDLRHLPLLTIDGEDARDFDDAVYAERRPQGGWRLYVAIADVSHYVKMHSALDHEAYQRGNSVYFPQRVVPMLPEKLSNELCSLQPKVDRLCMVCEINIAPNGKITKFQFSDAVMRSKARLTYTEVAAILAGKSKAHPEVHSHLHELNALYQVLSKQRETRGALEFDTIETRIIFGSERKIEKIVPVERNDAHRIIEECMLCANVAAAKLLQQHKMATLFRVHEGPDQEKLEKLRDFLSGLGLKLGGGDDPSPLDYARLIEKIEDRPDQHLIQTVLLRSLSQAVYSPAYEGHFGLAYDIYTHFTSPIRRYPDLLVHRAIRHIISGHARDSFPYNVKMMHTIGEHCSMTERRADEATRDATAWLKCEYMSDKIGEKFSGIISGVTSFGIFVELKDIYVEGLVHITALKNDYYHFDPSKHRLQGKRTGKIYRLGDPIKVLVAKVNVDEKEIDFDLA